MSIMDAESYEERAWKAETEIQRLERENAELRNRWSASQKALNQIDDAFEYRYGDDKARRKVQEILAEYTAALNPQKEPADEKNKTG